MGTSGIFDRRTYYDKGDQLVYYDLNSLGNVFGPAQASPVVGSGISKHIRIPVTSLFRNAPWIDALRPQGTPLPIRNNLLDLNGRMFHAIYIGHEVWGRGRIWSQFSNFTMYRFLASP